jgi:hypothetical protein
MEKGQSPKSGKQSRTCLDTLNDSRRIHPNRQVKFNRDLPRLPFYSGLPAPFYRKIRSCLLIEPKVKAKAPNIALMKWARWCECQSITYQYVRGKVVPDITPDIMLMSCIFSFCSKKYEETINFYKNLFPGLPIVVGGVFPTLKPQWFVERWNGRLTNGTPEIWIHPGLCKEIETLPPKFNVKIKHEGKLPYARNKIVAYASRGCVNRCGYCAVPRTEGEMRSFKTIKNVLDTAIREMPNAESVVLYDNNFTEHIYFENIVYELVQVGLPVDIHGLHVESFTERHAQLLSKLKWASQGNNGTPYIRFSFDKFEYAADIERVAKLVAKYKINATLFCYMLFNFTDSPHDFWKRLVVAQDIVNRTGTPMSLFPQRYEPLNTLKRNQYIGPQWTDDMVRGLVKVATRLRGFLPVTSSGNIFRWIGYTEAEFVKKLQLAGRNNEIIKFTGDIVYLLEY